jgi:hypothetical protein
VVEVHPELAGPDDPLSGWACADYQEKPRKKLEGEAVAIGLFGMAHHLVVELVEGGLVGNDGSVGPPSDESDEGARGRPCLGHWPCLIPRKIK